MVGIEQAAEPSARVFLSLFCELRGVVGTTPARTSPCARGPPPLHMALLPPRRVNLDLTGCGRRGFLRRGYLKHTGGRVISVCHEPWHLNCPLHRPTRVKSNHEERIMPRPASCGGRSS